MMCVQFFASVIDTWEMRCWIYVILRHGMYEKLGPPVYLNVNMSISPPCVLTFMYAVKVTCKPALSCVTEQKEFWRQYFVALTNSSSTVMLKYLFHVPSLHSGNTSEGRKDWIHSNSLFFFLLSPLISKYFFSALTVEE